MIKIMLFGAGNFAKRHMEGIKGFAKSRSDLKIQVKIWDEFFYANSSDEQANVILANIFQDSDVECMFSPPKPEETFDISIDATNVQGRAKNLFVVSNLKILEKPLANTLDRVDEIWSKDTLRHAKVNCSRRLWAIYADIKNELQIEDDYFQIHVKLNRAGLLSNAIHFFDLFEWLSGMKIKGVEIPNLKVFESKRSGFSEGYGLVNAYSEEAPCNTFMTIEDKGDASQTPSSVVEILTKDTRIMIYETLGQITTTSKAKTNTIPFEPSHNFQSKLTLEILENYITRRVCDLPDAEEVLRANKMFLTAISKVEGNIAFT